LALAAGADGVHLPAAQLASCITRPDLPLVAASCHSAAELERAAALGCDFTVFGPVRASASHPGVPGIGWEAFAAEIAVPPAPTFALGGLTAADLETAQRAGAHGIAAIRAAW
ncbi:MAG: thiamine phosphate synthase, partial [Sulfuritalea sp.]|nr:thiamine phosphate synthase [Sulfuritalea sp.]